MILNSVFLCIHYSAGWIYRYLHYQGDSYYHCILILASLKTSGHGSLALRGGLSVVSCPSSALAVCVDGRHFAIWQHPQLSYSFWKGQKVPSGATLAYSRKKKKEWWKKVYCKLCSTSIKYSGNTTNLHFHLKEHYNVYEYWKNLIKLAIEIVIVPLSPSTNTLTILTVISRWLAMPQRCHSIQWDMDETWWRQGALEF